MSGLKRKKAGDLCGAGFAVNHGTGKLVIPQMRYEPTIDNEAVTLPKWRPIFVSNWRAKHHGMLVLVLASGRRCSVSGACRC